jgi:hypothetical protein
MGIQSGAPPDTNTDPRLDPVSEKADEPPLARAATLDNQAGGAARFADESPDGTRRGGGGDTSKRLGTRGRWVQCQPPSRRGARARVVGGMRRLF